jgi:ribose transport system ATP-binding protein
MSSSLVLEMSGISKRFPGVLALDDVNFSVSHGEIHGLVGENGAGKSTIIKCLAGMYVPDSGTVAIDGDPLDSVTAAEVAQRGIRFVHQELNLVPHFTVVESIFMGQEISGWGGVKRREMKKRARAILDDTLGVSLPLGALIRDISPAERKLVQIARALVLEGAKLVVFDEPTAPLAAGEVAKVLDAVRSLKQAGIAVVYVSHYLAEILDLCDRVTVLRNGRNAGHLDSPEAPSMAELIHLIVGRELADMFPPRSQNIGGEALGVTALSDGKKFSDITLQVKQGEIVGLAGVLGAGCEEIVDTLIGLRRLKSGTLTLAGKKVSISSPASALKKGMVLIPRDRRNDGLVLDLQVDENISLSTYQQVAVAGLVSVKKVLARGREMISALDIRPPTPTRKARFLSGGNQQKVVLARSLAAQATMFIFDEPTVGVDVGAKSEIYRLIRELADQGAGVLISSNEPAELLGMCDRILVVVRGEIIAEHSSDELSRDSLVEQMTGGTIA